MSFQDVVRAKNLFYDCESYKVHDLGTMNVIEARLRLETQHYFVVI
jgi:hypothetical protein